MIALGLLATCGTLVSSGSGDSASPEGALAGLIFLGGGFLAWRWADRIAKQRAREEQAGRQAALDAIDGETEARLKQVRERDYPPRPFPYRAPQRPESKPPSESE